MAIFTNWIILRCKCYHNTYDVCLHLFLFECKLYILLFYFELKIIPNFFFEKQSVNKEYCLTITHCNLFVYMF